MAPASVAASLMLTIGSLLIADFWNILGIFWLTYGIDFEQIGLFPKILQKSAKRGQIFNIKEAATEEAQWKKCKKGQIVIFLI